MISKRYARANNPCVQDYDPGQPSNYLMYLNANNVYGWTMGDTLPIHDFQWLDSDKINTMNVSSFPDDGNKGSVHEFD